MEGLKQRYLRLRLQNRESIREAKVLRSLFGTMEQRILKLQESARQESVRMRHLTEEQARLQNRVIVLKARNYDLTRQLAESNAFLEK